MALSESHKAVLLAELKANKVTNALNVYDSYCDALHLDRFQILWSCNLRVVSRLLHFRSSFLHAELIHQSSTVRYLFRAEQPRNGNWHWLYFSSAQFSDI